MKKVMVILGGGISGLSLRYFLSQKLPDASIILLEKSNRLGGVIDAIDEKGFFFERGPRTFKASRSLSLLKLIKKLGLSADCMVAHSHVAKRYLLQNDTLRLLPTRFPQALLSPITWRLLPGLVRDIWGSRSQIEDESIASFATRHFGAYVANTLFAPLTLGIYAGDSHLLSVSACFPRLKALEKEHASLIRAQFKQKRTNTWDYPFPRSALLTLKGGMHRLSQALAKQGQGEIRLNCPALEISLKQKRPIVKVAGGIIEADHICYALPPFALSSLLISCPPILEFCKKLDLACLSVIHLGYDQAVLRHSGFGYLTMPSDRNKLLGVVFDSEIFPEQNRHINQTRLSVMVKGALSKEEHALDFVFDALKRHLNIQIDPTFIEISRYPSTLPQYRIGHVQRVACLEEQISKNYPPLTLVGNFLEGVSVNDCIALAEKKCSQIQKKMSTSLL